jgi:hypothetical protein
MTPLPDKLRAALHESADEIPAEAPPLRLRPARRVRRPPPRWRSWAAPLASAALVVADVAASVTVAGVLKHRPSAAQAGPDSLPPYYVALTTQKPDADLQTYGATAAEIRSTATGAVLAKVAPPRPYVSFTGVTGAADDRTFVLSAQGPGDIPQNVSPPQYRYPAQRLFLLRIDPPGRMSLTALPAGYTPAGTAIHGLALSPDGTALAADVADQGGGVRVYVFGLATGNERAWSAGPCAGCTLASVGVNANALSWTADGRHVAFAWGSTVRLLDTGAPGSDLLAGSKTVAVWTAPPAGAMWRGAIITPDGRTVLGVEEVPTPAGLLLEHLVTFATATGRATAVLNTLNSLKLTGYEEILYTNATGRVLVVTYLRPGRNAAILHGGRSTSLPWSPYIGSAAW